MTTTYDLDKHNEAYNAIYWPIRTVIFYLFFLFLWRVIYVYHYDLDGLWSIARHGFRLDLSMACGMVVLSCVPWLIYLITGWDFIRKILLGFNIFIWTTVCLIEWSSILMSREWGSTLDARAVSYLQYPQEALATSKGFIAFWPTVFCLIILVSGMKRLVLHYRDWRPIRSIYLQSWLWACLVGPLAFLGLRGGYGKLPITPSDAFYSKDNLTNYGAVNKTWYFLYSLAKNTKQAVSISDQRYRQYLSQYQMDTTCTDTTSFSGRNIVFLVMEGWSHDVVNYLGSKENITPYFDSLSAVSTRFTRMYASGFRTDQGLPSILSGMPSIDGQNLLNNIDKAKRFSSLARSLKYKNYTSSFIYGGDLNFANMANYLLYQGIDTILSEVSFLAADHKTDWGVPDHIVAEKAVDIQDSQTSPFFSMVLFLSSHTPFETPIPNDIKGDDVSSRYKSSVKYSDEALSIYFDHARKEPWYQNTIFVITSDHGSGHTGIDNDVAARYHIPFIIFDPHASTGTEKGTIANHFDLPFTILSRLGVDAKDFVFGRDIYCPSPKRYAYFANDRIVGATPDGGDSKSFFEVVKYYYNSL
jgi:phosphoglycerol transferase MdoB-like AlkP superfamily enzyme